MMAQIIRIRLLQDNYAYLIHKGQTTVVVDPSEAPAVIETLSRQGWALNTILNTHHHWDHVGGNEALKTRFHCPVLVPPGDLNRVLAADQSLVLGSQAIGTLGFEVLSIPGHTRHHVALWLPEAHAVFTGDTLFAMGCGKLFEGTAKQMWESLCRLMQLPNETRIYCGHDYVAQNTRFALSLTPEDKEVLGRQEETEAPTLALEKATNPFLRLTEPGFRERFFPGCEGVEAFRRLRERKDRFA